jgi:hypothetical protein
MTNKTFSTPQQREAMRQSALTLAKSSFADCVHLGMQAVEEAQAALQRGKEAAWWDVVTRFMARQDAKRWEKQARRATRSADFFNNAVGELVALAPTESRQEPGTVFLCERPPQGWACTREPGHPGPCAAIPVRELSRTTTNGE